MSQKNEFEKYSYLINYEVEFRFYVQTIQLIGISFILLVLSHAVVNSSRGLITFNNIEVSGYYLLPLVLIIFVFLNSIYRFFYVDKKRVVIGLNFDKGLKIKLKWGPVIEIERFTLILNKRKLKFESQIPGLKPRKKYDYDYIGVQHNDTIYVIPYDDGYREELISLLEKANQLQPTPKVYQIVSVSENYLSKKNEFEKYSYLINYEVEFRFYINILTMIFMFICSILVIRAVFLSNRWAFSFFSITLSLYYLVFWLLGMSGFIYVIYRFFFVDKKRVVVGLNFDKGLKIKLKWGPVIEIDKFTLILNKRKLKFESQIPGLKPRKKYDYDYIGVQHNDTIYVIPYADGYREELISLLEKANQLKPTPKVYQIVSEVYLSKSDDFNNSNIYSSNVMSGSSDVRYDASDSYDYNWRKNKGLSQTSKTIKDSSMRKNKLSEYKQNKLIELLMQVLQLTQQ